MQVLHSELFQFPALAVLGLVTSHSLIMRQSAYAPPMLQWSKDLLHVDTKSLILFQSVPLHPSPGQAQSSDFSQPEGPWLY
jgi:hypothetical protein